MILQQKYLRLKDGWFGERVAGKLALLIQCFRFRVAVTAQQSATQGNMQVKQLNGGIDHNHTLSTEILIKMIANLVIICGITDCISCSQIEDMLVVLRRPDILIIDHYESKLSKYVY